MDSLLWLLQFGTHLHNHFIYHFRSDFLISLLAELQTMILLRALGFLRLMRSIYIYFSEHSRFFFLFLSLQFLFCNLKYLFELMPLILEHDLVVLTRAHMSIIAEWYWWLMRYSNFIITKHCFELRNLFKWRIRKVNLKIPLTLYFLK